MFYCTPCAFIHDQNSFLHIYQQQRPIYIKGLGSVPPIRFPSYIQLSEFIRLTVNNDPTKGTESNPILLDYSYLILYRFRDLVLTLPPTARNANGVPVQEGDINPTTIFVNPLVNERIKDYLPSRNVKGNEIISTFLSLAYLLGLYPIINSLSFFIAERMYPLNFDIYSNDALPFTSQEYDRLSNNISLSGFATAFPLNLLPQDLIEIIAKHIYLKHFNREEFTVLDYLGLHGQPSIIDGELNLEGSNITILSGLERIYLIHNVSSLNLMRNRILGTLLNAAQLKPLVQLRDLDLSSNDLMNISPPAFLHFTNLRTLNLSHNQLSSLSFWAFDFLLELEVLDLSNNHLSSLSRVFDHLDKLKTLDLSHNRLTSLPATIFNGLAHLRTLVLSFNSLSDLPETVFQNMGQLEVLNLEWNNLMAIPRDTFISLRSLRELNVSHNKIRGSKDSFLQQHPLYGNVNVLFSPQKEVFFYLPEL